MGDLLDSMTKGFMPHGFCLRWDPPLLMTMIIANAGVALAYFSIPLALWYFIRKRKDVPYAWMFRLFAMFITACGMTHVMKIWTLYQPFYWAEALVDLYTAGISLLTAFLLWPLIPKALALRSPQELEEINKKLEHEIMLGKQAEQKFRGLLESAPDALVIVNPKGEMVIINSQAEKLFSYSRDELLGKNAEMLVPERFRTENEQQKSSAYFTDPKSHIHGLELNGRRKDGTEFPIEISLGSIETAEGTLIASAIRDVSERRKLELSRAQLAAIVEYSDDAIISKTLDGYVTTWNKGAEELFGYKAEEMIGQPVSRLIPDDHPNDSAATVERLVAGERVEHYDAVRCRKDESVIDVSITASPIKSPSGRIVGASKIIRNITQRKEAEEALRVSEQRNRSIIENAYDPFVVIDAAGKIIDWNSKAEATFGWKRSEIIGKVLADTIIPERYRDSHTKGMQRFAETQEGPVINKRIEISALRRNGEEFPVELAIFPIHTAQSYYFCAFIRDISDEKEANEMQEKLADELRRSNAELQQFAYIAAHDLREPLRTIASYTALIGDQFSKSIDEDTRENMSFIISATKRMQQLIDDLLTYSRIHTHAKALQMTDCSAVIEKVKKLLLASIDESGAKINYANLPSVPADSPQLEQVFANLIANAIKFRSKFAPEIEVSAVPQNGDFWLFSIKDNGIGFDPAYKERIFNMFQRLHTIEEYPGTGIGLALCRRIIERHGGRIWAESETGKGATFYFTLPRQAS